MIKTKMTFMLLKAVKFHVYPVTQVIYNDAFTLIWPYFDDLLNFAVLNPITSDSRIVLQRKQKLMR